VSGAADATINFWRDVTEEEKEAAIEKREKILLEEQKLLNLMLNKNWSKALKLAINLEHPQRTLSIIKQILYEDDGFELLSKSLRSLQDFQQNTLLGFCVNWNTNSRHCYAAQSVCRILLSKSAPQLIGRLSSLKETAEGLIPYTQRHMERLAKLEQQSMILRYMLKNMHIASVDDRME